MSMIEDIKRDRETGTPGRWMVADYTCEDEFPGWYIIPESCVGTISKVGPAQDVDAKRCARVPDMEAAQLAAEELADAVSEWGAKGRTEATAAALNTALGNYRSATEAAA